MHVIDLHSYIRDVTDYIELRAQENCEVIISIIHGNTAVNRKSVTRGVAARVYNHGAWGFASHPALADDTIKGVVRTAAENAAFLHGRGARNLKELSRTRVVTEHDFSEGQPELSQKELLEFGKALDSYITTHYRQVTSRSISINVLTMEKSLATSDASSAYSLFPRTLLTVGLGIERKGETVEISSGYGGLGRFAANFSLPDRLLAQLDRQYEHLLRKKTGVYPKAGLADCILSPELAGVLAHEAIGHTAEADSVLGGSVAGDYLNQPVATPLVTLVDFAHTAFERPCPVPVFADDEGTQADDVVLIDQGVLKNFMHNKESALHFGATPTGNARASQFSDEPLIRMRNTAILPGKDHLAQMIASIDDGYYLMNASNGEADSTSEFMFGVVMGYEIKYGKLGRALKDTTISGVAFDVLKTVTMVSDAMSWKSGGICGKKQWIPVGMGGPALKCRLNIGGK